MLLLLLLNRRTLTKKSVQRRNSKDEATRTIQGLGSIKKKIINTYCSLEQSTQLSSLETEQQKSVIRIIKSTYTSFDLIFIDIHVSYLWMKGTGVFTASAVPHKFRTSSSCDATRSMLFASLTSKRSIRIARYTILLARDSENTSI